MRSRVRWLTPVTEIAFYPLVGMLEQVYAVIVHSLVIASISWTVTQEEIFSEWRELCADKCETGRTVITRKFFYVFTCEYCFSHWVTLAVIITTGFRLLIDDWRGSLIAFFVLPWVANQWMSIYRRVRVDIKKTNIVAERIKKEEPRSSDD